MAFAKKIGSLLKQSVSSTPCMSSSMHFSRGGLMVGNETDKLIRSCFATFNSKEIPTSVICDMDQKPTYGHYRDQLQQVRSYSSPPSKQAQIIGGYRGPPPSGAGGYGAPPQSSRCNYGLASDIYLKSYFNSIRPPTSSTFGFRLGRCIVLHFPKTTFIHLFAPRQPMQMRRRESPNPGKEKGRWWGFGKVRPIVCLQSSSDDRKKGKKEVAASAKGNDRDKLNEIQSSLKKTQRYGYHVHSPLRKNNFSKLLRLSGAFRHVKQPGAVNDMASLIENNDEAFKKTKLFKFLVPKRSTNSHVVKRALPALRGL